MYKTIEMTTSYLTKLAENTKDISRDEIELFVLPSYTSLSEAVKCTDRSLVHLGAQNLCWEDEGQFTGEISPVMLKEMNLDMVMVGHSERRHVFGERDEEENKKVKAALSHGLKVILCIGETLDDKTWGISEEVLRTQLKIDLYGVEPSHCSELLIGYEPVWSIGVNGLPASPDYAEKMHKAIKQCLKELYGSESEAIPVLYGGSVNPGNAEALIVQPSIDGLYVGRSAWDADKFDALIRQAMGALR